MKIYLASQSPRRQQLLQQIGVDFELLSINIDETARSGETAVETAQRLAEEKALAGWNHPQRTENIPVLAADTLGLLDGELLLKPVDKQDALSMLSKMSNREHEVITAVSVCLQGKLYNLLSCSKVLFCKLSKTEIEHYWQSGEPKDKAGSYAIQGIGGRFVKQINGSYSGIVGLPLQQTRELLEKVSKE